MGVRTSLSFMVRLLDADDGSYAEVRPARPGLLRVCAHVPAVAGVTDITWLRVALVADLLFRAAELRDLQVLTVLAFTGSPARQMETLGRAVGGLGIHPPAAQASLTEAHASPGGPADWTTWSARTPARTPARTGWCHAWVPPGSGGRAVTMRRGMCWPVPRTRSRSGSRCCPSPIISPPI